MNSKKTKLMREANHYPPATVEQIKPPFGGGHRLVLLYVMHVACI